MRRLLIIVPLFLVGCGGAGRAARWVNVSPARATLSPGESQTFVLNFPGFTEGRLEFWVVETPNSGPFVPGGGADTPTSTHYVYTAPNTPGTYHIRGAVIDEDGTAHERIATVTVVAPSVGQ